MPKTTTKQTTTKLTDNTYRAARVYAAALSRYPGPDTEGLSYTLSDLLCDVRHLCDAAGLDFNEIATRAEDHWTCETEGGENEGCYTPAQIRLAYEALKEDGVLS